MKTQIVSISQAKEPELSILNDLRKQAYEAIRTLNDLLVSSKPIVDAKQLETLEVEIVRATDCVAGLIIGVHVQVTVDDVEISKRDKQLADDHPKRFKSDGPRPVTIQPSRGESFEISVRYYRRKGGSKRIQNKGMYPAFILLGIHERHTPVAGAEMALMAAAMSSMKEAAHMLEQQGRSVDVKTIRSISYRYSLRARASINAQSFTLSDSVKGRRIAVSLDGGRIRIRSNKRGRKTKKGRTRFHAKWREPKLLHIWALDSEGRIDRSFLPVIDGTLRGPDEVFMLVRYYLQELDIQTADTVLFIADGAHWIWNRFERLICELSLNSKNIFQFLDFFHAVEHLNTLASLRKDWSSSYAKQWACKQRRCLKKGNIDKFIAAIKSACLGRKNKKIKTEKNYFLRNHHRLKFNTAKRHNLPMGSGPMESAIRRVINLRLKGAGIFWHEENADAMLLLRSFYKAGRWKTLVSIANSVPIEAFG